MKKLRLGSTVLGIALLANLSASAGVAYNAPVINRYGQVGLFYTQSAKTLGLGRLAIGAYGNAASDDNLIQGAYTFSTAESSWVQVPGYSPTIRVFDILPSIGYGFTRFLDMSAVMPIYADYLDKTADGSFGGFQSGFGDLEVGLKFQYPPYPHRRFFEMAYYGALSIPTGDRVKGLYPRHTYYYTESGIDVDTAAGEIQSSGLSSFYSSKAPELDMKMLWTFDLRHLHNASPVEVHVNYGVRWTFDPDLDHLFLLNLAFEYNPVDWLTLFTDFSGEARLGNIEKGFEIGSDPLRLSPGISITPPGGFFLTLGGDIDLSADSLSRYTKWGKAVDIAVQPQWRFAASIGWAGFILPQDADQDGIKDNEDRCPHDPEDIDGFEDSDGCPDPDNDNDGIPDVRDKCMNDPEDKDGFEDEDGCPDNDNDQDLIPDVDDECPMIPEDLDGFEDEDGCPDYDNDQDGIPDSTDHCPSDPEDIDGFADDDGCPDYDNDMDNVPDSVDNCPDVPGEIDNHGCPKEKPKAKEIKRGRVILRGVNFESGKAVLTNDSYAILDRVYESLVEWPEVKVEIRGHTDSVGSRLYNKLLSQRRANAVLDYLISRGISPDRLQASGRGEMEPIADNQTAEGRAMNRRVELHRID